MTQDEMYREAKNFFAVFEPKSEIISGVKIPGSIQILGDTFELNKGKVIAANINKSAFMFSQKRKDSDRSVQFYSQKYDEKIRMTLNEPQSRIEHGWANFISSTLFMLESMSKKVGGMNVYIKNEIPDDFSANNMETLEVGISKIASKFSDWELQPQETAEICAQGEATFMGRDKNVVKYLPLVFGKAGAVTFSDVADVASENIPVDLGNYVFMTMTSGLRKKNIEERKQATYEAVEESIKIMKRNGFQYDSLDKLTLEEFDDYRGKLSMSQKKRCAYFISENERVQQAKDVLAKGDMDAFIDIVNDSQKNIKNRLEIVSVENEMLLEIIQNSEEVKAVRLINMGTDGSVFAIVDKAKKKIFETRLKKHFLERIGLDLKTETFDLTNEQADVDIDVAEFKK